ncbi:MAG: protein-L-isoaspartate(D-aspartate) O-methyltransferase [Verrucomicrobiales bacterium]|nr:protein-L-isoaspartate(D-aspartate) O-methyltransferase [Verrucomicrobiales bacterium]
MVTSKRSRMTRYQPDGLGRDIWHPGVLDAMSRVPRHELVPPEYRHQAYGDHPLPIGYGQTISQPYIVALMTQTLDPQETDRVLEIGTGSGYQAAVLARLVHHVFTIEIIDALARHAAADLRRLGVTNVTVKTGNGHLGWAENAPFDAILVTCAPESVPPVLVEQLVDGGRMILPVGSAESGQDLVLLHKVRGTLQRRSVLPVRFVPMTGDPASHP